MFKPKIKFEKNDRYGFLMFTGNTFYKEHTKIVVYEFICDCGQIIRARGDVVARGEKKSCGCKSTTYHYRDKMIELGDDYPFHVLLTRSLERSKEKNIDFSITIEDIKNQYKLQDGKCFYTKQEILIPIGFSSKHASGPSIASIDRIDSSKGYIAGNIQLTTKVINLFKHALSHEEFIKMCNIISNNFPKK